MEEIDEPYYHRTGIKYDYLGHLVFELHFSRHWNHAVAVGIPWAAARKQVVQIWLLRDCGSRSIRFPGADFKYDHNPKCYPDFASDKGVDDSESVASACETCMPLEWNDSGTAESGASSSGRVCDCAC